MVFKLNPITGKLDLIEKDHLELDNIGTNTHAQIDTHITTNPDGTAQGQMCFWDATGSKWEHTEVSELCWNDTEKELGVGIVPSARLHIKGRDNSIYYAFTAVNSDDEIIFTAKNDKTSYFYNRIRLIGNNSSYPAFICESHSNTSWHGSYFSFNRSRGTATSQTTVWNNNVIFSFDLFGYDGNSYEKGAVLAGAVDGAVSDELVPMKWQFKTTNQTGVAPQIRMTVAANGHIALSANAPATSAALDIVSTDGALLLPRMTTAQKNALTAINGMLLYDSTLNQTQTYENGAWRQV